MRGQSLFLIEEKKLTEYSAKESDSEVKYRLAFLNAFMKIDYDLDKARNILQIARPTGYV